MPRHRAPTRRPGPSQALVRALLLAVGAGALVLTVGFGLASLDADRQARSDARDGLTAADRRHDTLDRLRARERAALTAAIAVRPLLAAAVADAANAERPSTGAIGDTTSSDGITSALAQLATRSGADAVVLVTPRQTLAAAGPLAADWPVGHRTSFIVDQSTAHAPDGVVRTDGAVYRSVWADLEYGGTVIGRLYAMSAIDGQYAAELGRAVDAAIVVLDDRRLIATSLSPTAARAFETRLRPVPTESGSADLGGEAFAFRRLWTAGPVGIYGLTSLDARADAAFSVHARALSVLAASVGILGLAGAFWFSKTVVEPARQLAQDLEELAWSPHPAIDLPPGGHGALNTVVDAIQELLAARASVEAGTQAACTGAMRAITAALDARDPHTVGHSERVSLLAVRIGRTLSLDDAQLDVLRLGALLHDIGNIGVPDAILRKPSPLSDEEFDRVRTHAAIGARILRSVPFLAPHVPIVELHHERPDGRGYPYGLRTQATPLAARIVRVADAYDAMTTTRAYRPALTPEDALDELWRCAGTGYDETVVEALTMAVSGEQGVALDAFEAASLHARNERITIG